MAYLAEKLENLKKKLKKSKSIKASQKRAHDLSSNSLDSDQNSGYSSPCNHLDRRFKLDKPLGIDLIPCDTHPIKATRTALDIIKANKKAIENSKTGKVTAVVAAMKIFLQGCQFTER